jgi:hypothetical protein
MPINSGDDLIAGLIAGPRIRFVKASVTSKGAGTFQSLWKVAGGPAAGASPPAFSAGSGYVPTKATAGALPFNNSTSPAVSYFAKYNARCTVAGSVLLADRVWACSGFGTVSTALQSVTTPGAMPSGRDPFAGGDCEPWIEIYTAPGGTGATWTVSGTDAAGNTGRTWTYAHPASAEVVGQMCQLLPGGASPAATLGIRQVDSFQASISSGTAGDVGVTVIRELAELPMELSNVGRVLDYAQLGLPRIFDDSALMLQMYCSAVTTGLLMGAVNLGQK